MSGPSRAEIQELLTQWRGKLSKAYAGQAPERVCPFYRDLKDRLSRTTGTPDLRLREYGRMLKKHLEIYGRGNPTTPINGQHPIGHDILLAIWYRLTTGWTYQMADKKARVEVAASAKDPQHWLHKLLPKFKNGILQEQAPIPDLNTSELSLTSAASPQ